MDRSGTAPAPAPARIPRTRGDGPVPNPKATAAQQDSPHPRGWTLLHRVGIPLKEGFPAPAGMDPAGARSDSSSSGIPRTRGDGPVSIERRSGRPPDSPHPRGWTLWRRREWVIPVGFPAPAGMDPVEAM